MATLVSLSSGRKLLQLTLHGKRRSVGIGRVSIARAEAIRGHVQELEVHANTAQPLAGATRGWVADLAKKSGKLYRRLVALGLVDDAVLPVRREAVLLGPWLDAHIKTRTDIKPQTRVVLTHVRADLTSHFGESFAMRDIDKVKAVEWNRAMKGKHAAATVAGRTKKARQMFREAVEAKVIDANPFIGIKAGKMNNPARQQYISRETVLRVIDACPDEEWKLIFALARFGGLRTPSETFRLDFSDIDWKRGRMTVHSPKTERHPGREKRVVPILPDLRPFLNDAEKVMVGGGGKLIKIHRGDNLRTEAERIIARAKLVRWPRLFQNLRSSWETDMATIVPLHVACAFAGNTEAVALGHYLTVTDAHFDMAARALSTASGSLRIEGGAHPTVKIDRLKGFADGMMTPTGRALKRFTRKFLRAHRSARAKTLQLLLTAFKQQKRELDRLQRQISKLRVRDIAALSRRIAAARSPRPDHTEAR